MPYIHIYTYIWVVCLSHVVDLLFRFPMNSPPNVDGLVYFPLVLIKDFIRIHPC